MSEGFLTPASGIGISHSHEVGGHHQKLFNLPRSDYVVSQFFHQVYPPRAEHVVRENEVFFGEYLDVLGFIYLHNAEIFVHHFYIHFHNYAFCCPNP